MRRDITAAAAARIMLGITGSFLAVQLILGLMRPLLSQGWMQLCLTGLASVIYILVPILILGRREGGSPLTGLGSPRGRGREVALAAAMALCGYWVVLPVQELWLALLRQLGAQPLPSAVPVMDSPWEMALGILCLAGCAAVTEEIALRGILLPGLRGRMGDRAALLLSSLFFALMHCSFSSLPYTFLFALMLGWLTLRSGSIYPAVIYHFVNNALAVVLEYVIGKEGALPLSPFGMLPAALVLLAGLILLYRRATAGAEPVRREEGEPLWWLPLAAAALVYLLFVIQSMVMELGGGVLCALMWSV